MSDSNEIAPDVLFAQKASAVAKCAGMDPRSMDLERFRSLAPVIFCKAYSTIYKETLPLDVNEEPEECMQYVIEGLLDKTSVGALTLITGSDVCVGSHRSIGVLVGCLFAEGQRMWVAKQEAKKKASVPKSDAAGVPTAPARSAVRPGSAAPTRGGRTAGRLPGVASASRAKGKTGTTPQKAPQPQQGSALDDDDNDDDGYADDFTQMETDREEIGNGEGGNVNSNSNNNSSNNDMPLPVTGSAEKKKRGGKKGARGKRSNNGYDDDVGVGLEDGLSPSRPPRAGSQEPQFEEGDDSQGGQDVQALLKRVAYLEGKLKGKKAARVGSPKRKARGTNGQNRPKTHVPGSRDRDDRGGGTQSSSNLGFSSPGGDAPVSLGKPQRVNRPSSAPSGSDLRANACKAQGDASQTEESLLAAAEGDAAGTGTGTVPRSPEDSRHVPDGPGGPNSHFTYDMKSGRRILMSDSEFAAREKRRELYLLGGAKAGAGNVHPGAPHDSTQVGEMWTPDSNMPLHALPKPPVVPNSPLREPTEAKWPGPSTGRSTEMWVKKHKESQDKALQAQLKKDEAVKAYMNPRFFPAYQHLEAGDMLVSIEHCFNCQCHNTTLRHKTGEYINHADNHLVSTAKLVHMLNLKVRLGVTRFAADVTAKSKESDANSRVGAFEIQVAYKAPSGSIHVEILHSKLSTRRWPSRQVVEKRLRTFASKYNVPSFYVPESDRESLEFSEFSEAGYPVGAGTWEGTNLGKDDQWYFDEDETMVYKQEESGGGATSPSKPRTGLKRAPTMLKAKNTSVARDIPPNITTQTDLQSVAFGWDSREFVMTPKYESGAIIAYGGASLFTTPKSSLQSNLGSKSFGASKVKHASKYSGFVELRTEMLPVMCEVLECKVDSESVFVRPIYSDSSHRVEVQLSAIEEVDSDVNALISSKPDLDHNVEGLLICAAMMMNGAEPRDDGNVSLAIAQEELSLACTLDSESAYNDVRSRKSAYHALRDCAAVVWEIAVNSNEWAGLGADEMDGSLRHPTRPDERFVPQMAYSEGCLDWIARVCAAAAEEAGSIDTKKLCKLAYGEEALVAITGGIASVGDANADRNADAAADTDAGSGADNNSNGDSVHMADPSLGGAVAVVFGVDGAPQFHVDEAGSPVASPARTSAPAAESAAENTETEAEAAASSSKASPKPSPRADSGSTGGDGDSNNDSAALKGKLDPMLAGFLDGLSDEEEAEDSPRGDDGENGGDDDDDDDDDLDFPSHPHMQVNAEADANGPASPGSQGEGYAEDFFDDL